MASGCLVPRSNVLFVFDLNRAFSASAFRGLGHECRNVLLRRMRHCRQLNARQSVSISTAKGKVSLSTDQASSKLDNRLIVEYKRGLPQVCIPLPTTQRECLFTLRPITNTVGDFLTMIQTEDKAVSTVSISTLDDIRIASSNTIESLMEDDFKLVVNEKVFYVKIPEKEKEAKEKELERLSDIRTLVNQLYVSLNVEEYVVQKEREILEHLEQLKIELEPMEKKKDELDAVAVRRTTSLTWIGLGLMSVQFGILARLTWWEYSWDIMEPVTYFVTYGTAMAAYAYFVLTKQEYLLPDVRDRQHLITVHKRASKIGLDLNHYNRLKESIAQLESDLSRLRDPINPYVPLKGDFSHLRVHVAKHSTPLERTKDNIMSLFNSLRKK